MLFLSKNQSNFRLIPIKKNEYFFEYRYKNKRLGVDNNNKFRLYHKKDIVDIPKTIWKIISLNNKEYLIQNNFTKFFIQANKFSLVCNKNINKQILDEFINITNDFKFDFLKLCEESIINKKYFIEKVIFWLFLNIKVGNFKLGYIKKIL